MSKEFNALSAEAMAWQDAAACRYADASLFFHPEGERGAARVARDTAAKEVCGRCVVRAACAEWALERREPYGVWGGLTEDEREVLLSHAGSQVAAELTAEGSAGGG